MPDDHVWKAFVSWMSESSRAEAQCNLMATYSKSSPRKLQGQGPHMPSDQHAQENNKRMKISVAPARNDNSEAIFADPSSIGGIEKNMSS